MAFLAARAVKGLANGARKGISGITKTLKNRASDLANNARSRFSRKQTGPEVPITTPHGQGVAVAPAAAHAEAPAVAAPAAAAVAEPSSPPIQSSDPGTMGGSDSIPVEGMVAKMYPRLKECLCESLARMFTDSSPQLVQVVVQTVEKKIHSDPGIRDYIDKRIEFISNSILKEQDTVDKIVASLTNNCKPAPVPTSGGTRKRRPRSHRYTRFVYKTQMRTGEVRPHLGMMPETRLRRVVGHQKI
jgi:hypothetical protein